MLICYVNPFVGLMKSQLVNISSLLYSSAKLSIVCVNQQLRTIFKLFSSICFHNIYVDPELLVDILSAGVVTLSMEMSANHRTEMYYVGVP